jgi:Flp pilus assembly protein TadD
MSTSNSIIRRAARAAFAFAVSLTIAGCASHGQLTTGSIPSSAAASRMSAEELDALTSRVGSAYEKNRDDREVGMKYASLLRMTGRNDQALAVMQQVAIKHPDDRDVLGAYGKAQAAAGQLDQALDTVRRAQTPDRPDWKLISAEGAILDQLGRSNEARSLYRKALDVQPNEPSVLSNLGMSYVLTGDLRTAESYLRKAAAQPAADSRIRQNLALVVGLQGRFDEAERIARAELPAREAAANIAYLRQMLAQQDSWSKLAAADKKSTAN